MAGEDGRWIRDSVRYGNDCTIRIAVDRETWRVVFCIEDIEKAAGYATIFPGYRMDRFAVVRGDGYAYAYDLICLGHGDHYSDIYKIRRKYGNSPKERLYQVTSFLMKEVPKIILRHYNPQEDAEPCPVGENECNARIVGLISRVNEACEKADAVLNRNSGSAA